MCVYVRGRGIEKYGFRIYFATLLQCWNDVLIVLHTHALLVILVIDPLQLTKGETVVWIWRALEYCIGHVYIHSMFFLHAMVTIPTGLSLSAAYMYSAVNDVLWVVCLSICYSSPPVESSWVQYDTPRTLVAESQMGSWEGTCTESPNGKRLDFTVLLLSLFTFSPHLVPSVQSWFASLPPSLSPPFLCPIFISAHPCPFIGPLFFFPWQCVGETKAFVCVSRRVEHMIMQVLRLCHHVVYQPPKVHLICSGC